MKTCKLKGKWGVDFRTRIDNKRHRINSPENTRRGAEAYLLLMQQKMARGEPLFAKKENNQPTFKEFSAEWFSAYVLSTNKPSDQSTKESILRVHLIPWFGNSKLQDITTYQVEQYKAEKVKNKLCAKTVNNHLAVLSKCLNCAVDWNKIDKIPKIKRLPVNPVSINFLSPLESNKLINDHSEPLWNDMILLALRTGMRAGEICGLEWKDIDMQNKIISVTKSLVRGVLGTPKNGKIRHIKISNDLYAMLSKRQRSNGRVFQTDQGDVDYYKSLKGLRRICKRVGIKKISWHILRHTFASTLVAEGIPLPVVQQLLGHADIKMTMRYTHLAPSATFDAINSLELAEAKAIALNKSGHYMGTNQKENS
jgi:integrase